MKDITSAPPSLYAADTPDADVREGFVAGDWPVAVYGLGKMGLPIAAVFADVTGVVEGVDIDASVVERVNRGQSPVVGEPGLDSLVAELSEAGKLTATVDAPSAARRATIHVVIVPTSIRGRNEPDLSTLRAVAESIGGGISAGDLVLVESTVPPGTTRAVVRATIAETSGLAVDEFGAAFCPERTSSGRALEDIRRAYPRVVGGVDEESTRLARLVYDEVTANEVIAAADAETAECVKLFEGVYRDVNIALANELATFSEELGVDVRAAIQAANTQPFCDIHSPGPGVGGHCIPNYPWFLTDGLSASAHLIATARYVNDRMPVFTAERCLTLLRRRGVPPDEATALLLGVAYRPDVAEFRHAPAVEIARTLTDSGVTVSAVDPVLSTLPELDATPVTLEETNELDPDAVVMVTTHSAFEAIDWSSFSDPIVIDCHDGIDPDELPHDRWVLGSD